MVPFLLTDKTHPQDVYEYMQKLSFPYHYETEYDRWECAFLRDTDGEGRALFRDLQTLGAYEHGKLIGFLQYGQSAFGFDENGAITPDISYAIIRNFYYDEGREDAGRELLHEALRRMAAFCQPDVYAFFHYFGMSCYARHGKLFQGFRHIKRLLECSGFCIEHENVFYTCKLDADALADTAVQCHWQGMTPFGQQHCDFRLDGQCVGGCELHFLECHGIAYLRWFYTADEFRGKGIGSSCMAALKSELLKRGIRRLDTDTAIGNRVAQHFYEKNHFVHEGSTQSYIKRVIDGGSSGKPPAECGRDGARNEYRLKENEK